MTFGPPASAENNAVLQVIRDAKAKGLSTDQVVVLARMTEEKARMHIKNLVASKKVVRMLERPNRHQMYAAAEFCPRKPNLPPRSDSVTVITKTSERNHSVSPERLTIEQALLDSTESLRTEALSSRTGVEISKVRRFLQVMRHDGFASNTGTTNDPRWRACVHIAAERAGSAKADKRFANGTQPAAPANYLPVMGCVRPGADDHRLVPSREGDTLKMYRAPVSTVGIGAGV